LLSAHYCPMDTIKMTSTQHRTTCTHTCIWDVLVSVQCVCKFTWRDLFPKQIKRVCYVQSHLYEHVHHECLYICNWWATINWYAGHRNCVCFEAWRCREREREISKTNKKSVLCAITLVWTCAS
jgi:hypothetical protein